MKEQFTFRDRLCVPPSRRQGGGLRQWPRRMLRLGVLVTSLHFAIGSTSGQETLRNAGIGQGATTMQASQLPSQNYTVKAGDFRLLVVPSMEVDYNDNVNLSKKDAFSSVILEPNVQLTASYLLTHQNLLTLNVGIGYWEYLEHSQYSGFRVTSASQMNFDTSVKDVHFNFHDRFSLTEDSGGEAAVANTGLYGTFMNTLGVLASWNLGDVQLDLGYDHQNTVSTSDIYSYLNRYAELPLARAGLKVRPDLTVGLEATAAYTTYEQEVLNNNENYSGGVYADWKLGSYFDIQPRAGYTIYQFDGSSRAGLPPIVDPGAPPPPPTPSGPIETSSVNTWYANLTMTHKFSSIAGYTLNAGREIRLGIQSDLIEDYYFRPSINWQFIKNLEFNTSIQYEHGSEGSGNVSGNLTETYDWYGGSLGLKYQLMKNLKLGLTYRLTIRASNIPDREYSQNVVGISLLYQAQ